MRTTRKKAIRRKKGTRMAAGVLLALVICLCYHLYASVFHHGGIISRALGRIETSGGNGEGQVISFGDLKVTQQLLSVSENSRLGRKMKKVNGIVIHYTGNPGTTAAANRNYFQSLAYNKSNYASAHFVVGLEGEIVQCVPLDEEAITTRGRNGDTIGIEVCHPDAGGKFNDCTYESLIKLTALLCDKFGLTEADVMRHYDVTGKICPKYYVEHDDAWEKMLQDISMELHQSVR